MKQFKTSFLYLIKVHALGLIVLTLLRLGLFVVGQHFLGNEAIGDLSLQATAFVRGLWFDNVIACYLLLLPLFVALVGYEMGYLGRRLLVPITRFMQIMWGVVIFISAADIPYFLYFFKHLNASIWNWAEYGATGMGMIFGEPSYYPPLAVFIVLLVMFVMLTNRFMRKAVARHFHLSLKHRIWGGCIGLILIGLCIFGIRGRVGYNPIKVSAAYYCEDAFLNQLGVNPTFNLLTSTLDEFRPENRELHLMDTDEAIRNISQYYGWNEAITLSSPNKENKKNVVLILMESMSAHLMERFGNKEHLTPFLDSLAQQSLFFTNCYSAGIHTNHGIFSTLYSFPALMGRNMMKGTDIPHYEGLPTELQRNGYRTMFFMTHESQYDNMNAFLRTNGYDEIFSQEDYPAEKVANSFGVQDDFLFSYALDRLNEKSSSPFFATLLTISNHPPYVLPEWFDAKNKDDEKAIVEYADHSIRRFFEAASHCSWYKNTIFILLGDHGKLIEKADNEMPESYNHIPLIIYSPDIKPAEIDGWATQMDVQRTVLSLLGMDSRLKNFSVDLLSQPRPCAVYTADDVMGTRCNGHLYIYRPATKQEFMYHDGMLTHQRDTTFQHLRTILFSHLQTMQALVKKH